jgi:uncharacterized membrane protein HdeD (DUF308 family)
MGWKYTNRKPSQLGPVGIAMTALGAVMLVFGVWHFHWNHALMDSGTMQVSTAQYRAMAMPAVFGLAVLIGGAVVAISARRQHRHL